MRRRAWAGILLLSALGACKGSCRESGEARRDERPLRERKEAGKPSVVELCLDGVRAQTEHTGRCEGEQWWGSVEREVELLRPVCEALAKAPGVRYDQGHLAKCVAAYEKLGCDDPPPVECQTDGTLDDGTPCLFTGQCKSGSTCATGPTPPCGRCTRLSNEGEECGVACNDGLACIDGRCAKPRKEGARCTGFRDCARGTFCKTSAGSFEGTCFRYLGEGKACDPGDCDPRHRCVAGRCEKRPAPKRPGEPCEESLDCLDFSCVKKTCTRLSEEGEPCPSGEDWERPFCAPAFSCTGGKCTRKLASSCTDE